MTRRRDEFDQFMAEVEAEAEASGKSEELAVYAAHFRLAADSLRLRRELGWTQQELARASGVQQSEISRIERGQGNPTFQTLSKLAAAGGKRLSFVSERRALAKKPPQRRSAARAR